MKKIVLFFTIFVLFISKSWSYCIDNSSSIQYNINSKKREISSYEAQSAWSWINNSSVYQRNVSILKGELSSLETLLYKEKEIYNNCIKEEDLNKIFNKWYDAYKNKDYLEAVYQYEKYLKKIEKKSENYLIAKDNLSLTYFVLAWLSFDKDEFDNSIKYYNKAEKLWYQNKYSIYFNMWASYQNLSDFENALIYYKKSKNITFDSKKKEESNNRIKLLENFKIDEKLKKDNTASNDLYSYKQIYIKDLNIREAQKSFSKNKEVIIAVIDDWISINHSDLTDNIWVNKNEIPWNGIDDDKNWYIDDFNWWNFASDNFINILPAWGHWTNVAWIIWAGVNNNEWILWISNNVKIMNLRAFELAKDWEEWWAYTENIINAMNYAIDNWADIINLSLVSNQFLSLQNDYNKVIDRAYENNVIVVVAAWNWDKLSDNWVNTTVNKLSPVCNEWNNYKKIIWVWAFDKLWYRTNWSNYWDCVDFYVLWEWLYTTSIKAYSWNDYEPVTWTSFSAPIVSWIIWLWYNKYWKISSDLVYDSLKNSLVKNKVWNDQIDAKKYLEELWKAKIKYDKNIKLKNKSNLILIQIKKSTKKYSSIKKIKIYQKYITLLGKYSNKLKKWDKKIIIDFLIEWMKKEIE